MIKNFFYSILLSITLFAVDTLTVDNLSAQKQDTLYVQNMIEIEENIAKNFEKYLLIEYSIPTMEKLISDDYLGSNFSVINKMGENIDFKDSSSLKLKYAVTKDAYRKKRDLTVGINNYIVQLYNRDLYRNYTYAYDDTTDILKSYVEFKLESPEAKTIFKILNEGYTIAKTCTDSLKNTYCNYDTNSIRWYNSASNWIEYDKKNFEDGNVTILSSSVINDPKLDNLKVGVYIFIQNTSRYVKLIDNKILKVD
jgi:hypothetical protein